MHIPAIPHLNKLIIATTDILLKEMESYAKGCHKPFEVLQSRSDSKTIKQAIDGNKYILSGIDYVGGLEFDASWFACSLLSIPVFFMTLISPNVIFV